MPVGGIGYGYYNNPYYNYAGGGNFSRVNFYGSDQYYRQDKGGSVVGKVVLGTTGLSLLTLGLAVLQKRFKFLPKDGNLDKAAKWLTEKCQNLAAKGKNKLDEKYPTPKEGEERKKFPEFLKKTLGHIEEFFKKEGKAKKKKS